jgi:hypothetical protein
VGEPMMLLVQPVRQYPANKSKSSTCSANYNSDL